jgi:Transposase and inactivated derivatives
VISLSRTYITDVLSDTQLEFIAHHLPYPKAQTGRPSYANRELLPGILKVLRSGSRWRDLDRSDCPSGITHWRRLRFWQKACGFDSLWKLLLELLFSEQKLVLKTASIDGTLVPSFSFKDTTSYSGKHHKTGTKVSLVVEEEGLPLSALLAVGSAHDGPLAIPTIQNIPEAILKEIEKILADKGYDDTKIRIFIDNLGIASDIPQRELPMSWEEKIKLKEKLKLKNQKSNNKRFVVERTNAWTKSFRRLRFRYDYTMLSFLGFLNLAFCVMCVRKLLP